MKKISLLSVYIAISLLVGKEFHPFSRFPMYNSFPNWSYVFFLKNEKNENVYYDKNFPSRNKSAGYVAHTFYTSFDHHQYKYGFGKEDSTQLAETGKELLNMVLRGENKNKFDFDTLQLWRRYYFLKDGKLNFRDDFIYAQAVQP